MIDAREDIMTAPAAQNRRRRPAAAVSNPRNARRETETTRKSTGFQRVFSDAKVKPFDQIEWDRRTAEITDDGGKVIFKQENVEVPKSRSVLATKVVVEIFLRRTKHPPSAKPPCASSSIVSPAPSRTGALKTATSAKPKANCSTTNSPGSA